MPFRFTFLPRRDEIAALLRLAVPVVVVQLGLMAMGVVDTLMVGHVSPTALAGVALGNLYVYSLAMLAFGILMALDPVVSQAVGAGDRAGVANGVQRGMLLAAAASVPLSLAMLPAGWLLGRLGQPVDVVPLAASYARVSAPGMFPFLAFVVLRQSLQAMHRTGAIVLATLLGNLVNAGLNLVLIFGKLGFPALGVTGSALATTLSRWALASMLIAFAWRELRPAFVPWRPETFAWRPLARMVTLGVPIAVQIELESGAFAFVALMMGRLGTVPMAGHQIAINVASLTFMVPLGVGSAAAVLVGHAVGRGDATGARRATGAALAVGTSFMSLSALAFLLAPGAIAHAYTSSPEVAAIGMALLPIAGVFQIFDGLQVVAAGILRGMGDTRAPMVVSLLGFWLIGVPVSLALGIWGDAGPRGLWWGFVAGLAAVATFLLLRVRARLRRPLVRVRVDDAAPEPATISG